MISSRRIPREAVLLHQDRLFRELPRFAVYRIEIAEVESALLAHTAVREAAVAIGDEASGESKLLAYMVARDAVASERQRVQTGSVAAGETSRLQAEIGGDD